MPITKPKGVDNSGVVKVMKRRTTDRFFISRGKTIERKPGNLGAKWEFADTLLKILSDGHTKRLRVSQALNLNCETT